MKTYVIYFLIFAFIFSAFLSTPVVYNNKSNKQSYTNGYLNTKANLVKSNVIPIIIPPPPTGLPSHSAMTIIGDNAISSFSSGGDGSVGNPYQINSWSFTVTGTAITITNTSKSIVIENCLINMQGSGTGIDLTNASNIVMKNLYIENDNYGIYGYGVSTNDVIENSTFVTFNTLAISTFSFQNLAILSNYFYWSSNTISGSAVGVSYTSSVEFGYNYIDNAWYSLQISFCSGVKVFNNIVLNSFAYGLSIQNSVNAQIYSNTVTGASDGIFLSGKNATVYNNHVSAWRSITIAGLGNSVIRDNNVLNSGQYGIFLSSLVNSQVENNYISNSTSLGMFIVDSNENTITHNTIQQAMSLVFMFGSSFNILSYNTYKMSYDNQTELQNSNGNSILNSTFDNSGNFSVVLSGGSNTKVIQNVFHGSKNYDLYIQLDKGNTIERNEFLDINAYGGAQAYDDGGFNTFAFNYWKGWTSPDLNHDGFVDLGRVVDGSAKSIDLFPLVSTNQISNPYMYLTNNSSTVTVIISNGTTITKNKASPGFTVEMLLLGFPIVAVLAIFKRKKFSN